MWRPGLLFLCLMIAVQALDEKKFCYDVRSPYYNKKCMDGPKKCTKSKYRSIDGSCNNYFQPSWGMPNHPYGRMLPWNYADGLHALPTQSNGEALPSARLVSDQIFPVKDLRDHKLTLSVMQYGQLVAHDQSFTADATQFGVSTNPVTCCANGQLGPDASDTERCAPILIPADDPVYGPQNIKCIDMERTGTTKTRGCSGAGQVAKPLSVVTSWLDVSIVYGSSQEKSDKLRAFKGGRLLTNKRNGQEWPPQVENVAQTCPASKSASELCFRTGDIRANQNPGLVTLQVLWFREHNLIADALQKINPHWTDEKTFQVARSINIAKFQRITYTEYLPLILGKECMIKEKLLFENAKHCVNDYDHKINPATLDEHATAAFRSLHSAIMGKIELYDEERDKVSDPLILSDWIGRPESLDMNSTVNINTLIRGLATQCQHRVGKHVDIEINRFLFKDTKKTDQKDNLGIDLTAVDIQRSRDHGIAPWMAYREYCNLPVANNYDVLAEITKISEKDVVKLMTMYDKVEDIELRVGGSLEPLLPGTATGETFHCIILEHFKRTRRADRFFYQNCEANALTPEQLHTIHKNATMAKVFCDTGNKVKYMQPRSFEKIDDSNKLTHCKKLPTVDLTLWKENPKTKKSRNPKTRRPQIDENIKELTNAIL